MAADDGDVLVVFGAQPAAPAWSAVGDPVMGGRSTGALTSLDATTSVFHGEVSLANGGGFASVQVALPPGRVSGDRHALWLRARGDGGAYKLGVRMQRGSGEPVYQHALALPAGEWIEQTLPLAAFVATWRGREVSNAPALDPRRLCMVSLYTAGRQPGPFRLELDTALLAV